MATHDWDIYTLSVVTLNGTQYDGVNDFNEDPGVTLFRHRSSGRIHYSQAGVLTHNPVFTFTTPELATILGQVSPECAVAISSTAVFYWSKKDDECRASSGHLTTTVNEGIIVLNSLTWPGEADVWRANVAVHAAWDGTNNPFVHGTAALPSRALIDEAFVGGMIKVDPVGAGASAEAFAGWNSATLNFGYTVEPKYAQGHEYPGRQVLNTGEVTLEFTHPDVSLRSTYTPGVRNEGVVLFIRKADTAAANSTVARVADGTAQHIKLETKSSVIKANASTAADGSDAQITLMATFEETASQNAVIYTANQAIA